MIRAAIATICSVPATAWLLLGIETGDVFPYYISAAWVGGAILLLWLVPRRVK